MIWSLEGQKHWHIKNGSNKLLLMSQLNPKTRMFQITFVTRNLKVKGKYNLQSAWFVVTRQLSRKYTWEQLINN